MLGMIATSPVRADDTVGSVTQVAGNAQIQRAGASMPAQQGAPVKLHDQVVTGTDGSLTMGFADGSSIALSPGTVLLIEDVSMINGQALPSRVMLLSGRVHTNVPDRTSQQHSIEVETQNATATGPAPGH